MSQKVCKIEIRLFLEEKRKKRLKRSWMRDGSSQFEIRVSLFQEINLVRKPRLAFPEICPPSDKHARPKFVYFSQLFQLAG